MPTINYYYADVYPDQLEMPDFSVEISMEEWNRRIEQEHHWESNGRMARREVSLFDMIHAEILGEHNAEKARVRNRRKADRKHKVLPEERKHREEMRKDRMFGYYYNENCPKVMFAPDSLPIKYRKDAESDRIARADWERDLADWDYDIAYEEFNAEICREDICELNMEIQSLEYQLSDVDILRNRLENLRKERDVTEKYLRNSEEFLRKYMWVKEML